MSSLSKLLFWFGIILILITGAIHIMDAPDSFGDAAYKGWLFYANGAACLVAAFGMHQKKHWGWLLGLLITVGSFVAYIISRTIGLPMIPAEPDAFFEPLGIASLIAEGLYVVIFIKVNSCKK